jgi:hypothetical protein
VIIYLFIYFYFKETWQKKSIQIKLGMSMTKKSSLRTFEGAEDFA